MKVADVPIEKKFAVLCEIVRAQHFAWRRAVEELCPEVDAVAVVTRMWEITGRQTAAAYLKRVDPEAPLAPQLADSIVWSSRSMGEDARAEIPDPAPGDTPADEAFVRHLDCPWCKWHRRHDLEAEDRPGCDAWFRTIVEEVNQALDGRLRVETIEALPDGGDCCLRRLWVEEP
jgi:hypothetical protein